MANDVSEPSSPAAGSSRADTALGLAAAAVVLYVLAIIFASDDEDSLGFLWPVAGVVGAVAAYAAWRAGRPRPRGRALAALIVGGLIFLLILGWTLVALISGEDL